MNMDEGNRKIMWGMFFVVVGLAFFLPLVDNDFGWHYVCGERILLGSRWCLENDLTYLLPGYKWAYTAFIYDALLAWGYNLGGFVFLSLMGSGLVVLITYLAIKQVRGPDWWRMGIVAFTLLLSKLTLFSLGLRSQWMSLLGLVWLLSELMRKNPRWKWVLMASWLWANSHSGFFLAPVAVGVCWMGGMISRFLDSLRGCHVAYTPRNDGFLMLATVGVTLLNPFGFEVYMELWRHFRMPLNSLVAEWVSPIGWQYWSVWLLGLMGMGWLLIIKGKIRSKLWFRVGMMLVLMWLALSARRNLVPFYFGWLILVAADWWQGKKRFEAGNLMIVMAVLPVLLIYFGIKTPRTIKMDTDWHEYCSKGYVNLPCGAVEYLRGKRGRVYNTYEWGGFLIWQLPEMKMFVDGRMPAWESPPTHEATARQSESPYTIWLEVLQVQPGWNEYLLDMGTEYLLIAPGTFMDLELDKGGAASYGWNEEYRDKGAVVYGRI